jgi:hypothetical protein
VETELGLELLVNQVREEWAEALVTLFIPRPHSAPLAERSLSRLALVAQAALRSPRLALATLERLAD